EGFGMSAFHILRRSGAQHVAVLLDGRLVLARRRCGLRVAIAAVAVVLSLRLLVAARVLLVAALVAIITALIAGGAALAKLFTDVLASHLLALAQQLVEHGHEIGLLGIAGAVRRGTALTSLNSPAVLLVPRIRRFSSSLRSAQ